MARSGGFDERPASVMSAASSNESEKDDMWSSMLSSVASSKRLPQKSILVLGGSADGQKEFVESLGVGGAGSGGGHRKADKRPPIANAFALGYTYLDVLDSDHEDVLARLGVYLISEPTPSFIPLLRPLFTAATLPETLIVILLDWSKPWDWTREIKTWVRLVRGIFTSLDDDCRRTLDEVTHAWETRRSTYTDSGGGGVGEVTIPLGPGEFDEPIGLPLCVVCQNADKIEVLERERGWKEEEFDFVLQFLRTILLKHGASLIYTTPSAPSPIRPLIFSLLSIQSPQRQQVLKHNVIERDKVLVPPHWDSWGKIRVLREGFDVEGINSGWSVDISPHVEEPESEGGAVEVYEDVIKESKRGDTEGIALLNKNGGKGIEVPAVDTQEFLATQLEVLEARAAEEKAARGGKEDKNNQNHGSGERVIEHVGPVQFNVGGIQVDAENMLERLKEREASRASDREPSLAIQGGGDGKSQNEVLSAFFNSLMKKKGTPAKGTSPGS